MQDRKSYDRTYAVVDLGRIVENLRLCKEKLRKGMAVCAVVKMDAYGHGIVEVAKAIEDECAMFGVATVEEAITLRKAGIERYLDSRCYSGKSICSSLRISDYAKPLYFETA